MRVCVRVCVLGTVFPKKKQQVILTWTMVLQRLMQARENSLGLSGDLYVYVVRTSVDGNAD